MHEFAALFYVLWAEHFLNGMVLTFAGRRHIPRSDVTQLIRKTDLRDKCTWVLRLLGERALPERHVKRIARMAEVRNSFVHYKWPEMDDSRQRAVMDVMREFSKTLVFLRRYWNRRVMLGSTRRLERLCPSGFAEVSRSAARSPRHLSGCAST
jgi:hypothetical protein